MHLKYVRTASYRGVDLHTFIKEFEDFSANNLTCFCRQPDRCPIQGTMDLMPCVQVPVTVSLPHFYGAHPSLLANIASGLEPNQKKHEFYISLELVNVSSLYILHQTQSFNFHPHIPKRFQE